MRSIDLADITALQALIPPGSTEPIRVTSNGQTVAAVVPVVGEGDLEDLLLSCNRQFEAILQRSQQRLEKDGGLSPAEVRRRLNLPAS